MPNTLITTFELFRSELKDTSNDLSFKFIPADRNLHITSKDISAKANITAITERLTASLGLEYINHSTSAKIEFKIKL